MPIEYRRALPSERADIVDFANYVFSQAHEPHNFKTLLPKAYSDEAPDFTSWHFVAMQDDRIRAMVACKPERFRIGDCVLKCGSVGTVSVHPYARGEGHMKKLLPMVVESAKNEGMDLMILGGQRQRYNYFGFEHAGANPTFRLTGSSLHHSLEKWNLPKLTVRDMTREDVPFAQKLFGAQIWIAERPTEQTIDIMKNWHAEACILEQDGNPVGIFSGKDAQEILLEDEKLFAAALLAIYNNSEDKELNVTAAPWQKERIAVLSVCSEKMFIQSNEMVRVLNWKNVLEALLMLKKSYHPLKDGRMCLNIENQGIEICVKDGKPAVRECAPEGESISTLEAERRVFSMMPMITGEEDWFPLPFLVNPVDKF